MPINTERKENNKIELKIEVSAIEVNTAIEEAYKKIGRESKIPGFREGKIPKNVLGKFIGREVFYQEALENLIPKAYFQALKETRLETIAPPKISEIKDLKENEPFSFKAEVEIKPEVELHPYKDIEVTKKKTLITEEDVERNLELLRQRSANLVKVERAVEKGDVVILDLKAFVEGETWEGLDGKKVSLEVGFGGFFKEIEESIIGDKEGTEKEIQITIPENFPDERYRGKKAKFKLKILDIREKKLSELNDEFAKTMGKVETLNELRDRIKNELEENAKLYSKKQCEDEILKKVVSNSKVSIPKTLIDIEVNRRLQHIARDIQSQGLKLEDYFDDTGLRDKKLLEEIFKESEEIVKVDLVLDAIAKKENIEVNEEEVDLEVEKMAKGFKKDKDKFKEILRGEGNIPQLIESLMREKTINFLVSCAKIKEEEVGK